MAKTVSVGDALRELPVGSLVERTEGGFSVKRRTSNGYQHGAGKTLLDALADIGAIHPDALDQK